MGSGAKNPGLPSNADAKDGPTRCVAMLGRFKGKHVPFGSRLLVTSVDVLERFGVRARESNICYDRLSTQISILFNINGLFIS